MHTIAQAPVERSSTDDSDNEPPSSKQKPRKQKRRAAARGVVTPLHGHTTTELAEELGRRSRRNREMGDDVEGFHQKRIAARLEQERKELAEQAQAYIEIANEVDSPSFDGQRMESVLATAIGAYPGDPLTVIVEEIKRRCTTLSFTARAGSSAPHTDYIDVLDTIELELQMLATRASVAGELLRRFGGLHAHCDALRKPLLAAEGV